MSSTPRVALVTGASSGIGKAVVECFVRDGVAVVVCDVSEADGQAVVESLKAEGGKAVFVHCDVTDPGAHVHAVEVTVQTFGRLDIAVNNAGIAGDAAPTADYPIDSWKRVMDVNLNGVFYGMRAQIPAMLKTGGGSIVNIASILGSVGFASAPAYVTAKHGIVGLTQAAALDHATQGIRVNAVGPGFIRTPMLHAMNEDVAVHDALVALHPIGRLGEPNEVAELVCFLASEKASFMTGSYYPVDGGYLAR